MKRTLSILSISALVTTLVAAAGAAEKQPPFVKVGLLTAPLDDVGCFFSERREESYDKQIFKSGPDGTWMNLNGEDTMLEPVTDPGDTRVQTYKTGDITVTVNFGRPKRHEAGASYNRAQITLTRNGQKINIKAKGGCGC